METIREVFDKIAVSKWRGRHWITHCLLNLNQYVCWISLYTRRTLQSWFRLRPHGMQFNSPQMGQVASLSSPSKRKGNSFERELVALAKGWGLSAQRAWGSNGRAMGEHEEVDCKIEEYTVQAKRRKSIAKFLKCEHTDIVAFREDRGDTYALMPMEIFLTLLKKLKG